MCSKERFSVPNNQAIRFVSKEYYLLPNHIPILEQWQLSPGKSILVQTYHVLICKASRLLPKPVNVSLSDDEEDVAPVVDLVPRVVIPAYGQRSGWRPTKPEDFGDGGSYPECHIAQYPLEMGRKKVRCMGDEIQFSIF